MKKVLFLSLLCLAIINITLAQSKTKAIDYSTSKKDLTETLEKIYLAYNTRDIKSFLSLMDDDGLFCGTDSRNIWDKAAYSKLMTEMFADTSFSPNISVDKREIHFDTGRNSAMVVDQFFFPGINKYRYVM